MLQKLTIVQALVEMLRDRDFTYFSKETLFILSEEPKSRDIPGGSAALVPMLREIFQIVKLLKAYYDLKPGVDMSYAQVIYSRMRDIKSRVMPEVSEDEFQPQILHKHLEIIQESFNVKSTIDNRLKPVKRPESQASIKSKR
jgi:hypothetical protein